MAHCLNELTRLYRRLAAAAVPDLPIEGWDIENIRYLVDLTPEGKFAGLTLRGEDESGLMAPWWPIRGSNIKACILWDNPLYIWGLAAGAGGERKPEDANKRRQAFRAQVQAVADRGDAGAGLVLKYLDSGHTPVKHPLWEAWRKKGGSAAFRLQGKTGLLCHSEKVQAYVQEQMALEAAAADKGGCLMTGEVGPLAKLHRPIRLYPGSGLQLVSFNFPSSTSYGKVQGENAPIGRRAMVEYTHALNWLLRSKQRVNIGPVTYVFWTERPSALETDLPLVDTRERREALKAMLKSMYTGKWPEADPGRCYMLGLREAPDGKRLNITCWYAGDYRELTGHLRQWYDDLGGEYAGWPMGMLFASLKNGNDLPDALKLELTTAAFGGMPLPPAIYSQALQLDRSEFSEREEPKNRWRFNARQALIRTHLIRNEGAKIATMLDESVDDVGYLLGRLLALFEQAQVMAVPYVEKDNHRSSTVADKFYGAACTQPLPAFMQLFKLNLRHLTSIRGDSKGLGIWIAKQLDAVTNRLPATIPATLSLREQGLFAMGFRHQRAQRWVKKNGNGNGTENGNNNTNESAPLMEVAAEEQA